MESRTPHDIQGRPRPAGDDPARWSDQAYPDDYKGQIQRAIGFSGISHDFFMVGKARWLERFVTRTHLYKREIALLDIGCGLGLLHPHLADLTQRIVGVDVSAEALDSARKSNPMFHYQQYEGEILPFDAAQFDIALAVTVMHHVPVDRWLSFVKEAFRVLKPGGVLVVIEHNPLNPLTRLAVNRCEFDADAVLLKARTTKNLIADAGFENVDCDYIFFTPFKSSLIQKVERKLRSFPLGAQYSAFGFKPGN
jgi:SAM-dependent methyltransferase